MSARVPRYHPSATPGLNPVAGGLVVAIGRPLVGPCLSAITRSWGTMAGRRSSGPAGEWTTGRHLAIDELPVEPDAPEPGRRDQSAGSVMGLLAAAADGTVVEIPAGIYYEPLVINRPVTMVAADGPGSVTITLDRPCVVRADTEIRGLTFIGA